MPSVIGGLEEFPALIMKTDPSLSKRLIVVAILVPAVVIFSFLGKWPFTVFVLIVVELAAYELWRLFHNGGYSPSLLVIGVSVPLAIVLRHLYEFSYSDLWLTAVILSAMFHHIIQQEKGRKTAATDFFITIGGTLYLGWLGSFAVSIRDLDGGLFWILLVLTIICMADTGAYAIGRAFGKHKMLPLVSPHKSWEGYLGGIVTGILVGWGLAAVWHHYTPSILPVHGILLGVVISILAPLGDFGESMIKRQFNVKDSSTALLDHGGFLDRIDSILWAVALGYYLIILIV